MAVAGKTKPESSLELDMLKVAFNITGSSDIGGPTKVSSQVPLIMCWGLLSWDVNDCLVDLEKELAIITEQAPEGEEARYGERLIQFASENLVTEVLIHPAISTLAQCVRNLLSSFTRHRHIIHAGYTFAANGSWALQDGTFSYADFAEAFQELEVQRVIRAYENSISVDIHCSPEGDWTKLPKEPFTKSCKMRINPVDVLTSGSPSISSFLNYVSPFLVSSDIETLLESSDVVGNIRFSHPTLYVFPGGQGDAALFGINGFNMLLDGGFSRKACFWDFVRHLDRLDAVLYTRLNNSNVSGINSVLKRKRQNAVYPQIGHFFCNIQERKSLLSPDGDKDKDPLLINLLEEGQDIVTNLRALSLSPQTCYRDSEPINLYHKVGHGTLDMYVLSPAKDSKDVKEFLHKWNNNDQKLFSNPRGGKDFQFPIQNLVSICALLVWQPASSSDSITRILFPGSTPQHKIFEGLDRLKQLECIKHPVCTDKDLTASKSIIGISHKTKENALEKLIQSDVRAQKLADSKPIRDKPKESKAKENKIESLKNGSANGVSDNNIQEKVVKKSDSTDSDKSATTKAPKPKKPENKEVMNGKGPEEKTTAAKPKPKDEPKSKIDSKPKLKSDGAVNRSVERKARPDKKPSPTTPKKTLDAKVNGDAKDKESKPKAISKFSPSATPAKSTKEANNRKVVESKDKVSKREVKPAPEKKAPVERKPISRKPKGPSPSRQPISPIKKLNGIQKPDLAKKGKLDKEGTTDSSTVSTPSAEQDNLKKDISKMTPEELEQLKAQELADLKEEQEVVKEIEAVFRKGEERETTSGESELRKVKDVSVEEKTEPEEYLIIEKEEIEHDSLEEKETKEDETQKHARDSEESEKQRKLSADKEPEEPVVEEPIVEKTSTDEGLVADASVPSKEIPAIKEPEKAAEPKEISATSPESKVDLSSEKKPEAVDEEAKEQAEQNNALESQPDEKISATIESGATTAPTLPEDERITLDEIKEDNGDQVIEEKHVKEETKEKDVPVIQLPPKTFEPIPKIPPVVGIRLDKQSHIRDIVKTPDEVADLPVHEEVDVVQYDDFQQDGQDKLKPEAKQEIPAEQTKQELNTEKSKDAIEKKSEEPTHIVDNEKVDDKKEKIEEKETVLENIQETKVSDLKDLKTDHDKDVETEKKEVEELNKEHKAEEIRSSDKKEVEVLQKEIEKKEVELLDKDHRVEETNKIKEEIKDLHKVVDTEKKEVELLDKEHKTEESEMKDETKHVHKEEEIDKKEIHLLDKEHKIEEIHTSDMKEHIKDLHTNVETDKNELELADKELKIEESGIKDDIIDTEIQKKKVELKSKEHDVEEKEEEIHISDMKEEIKQIRKDEEIDKKEEDLLHKEHKIDEIQTSDIKDEIIDGPKDAEIEKKEVELKSKEHDVEEKEKEIHRKENEIEEKEFDIHKKEVEVDQKEKEIDEKETEVGKKEDDIGRKEFLIEQQEIDIEKKELFIEKHEVDIEKKEVVLEKKELDVEKKEIDIEKKEIALEKDEVEVEKKEIAKEKEEVDLEKKEVDLEKKEVIQDKKEIEMEREEIAVERKQNGDLEREDNQRKSENEIEIKDGEAKEDDKRDDSVDNKIESLVNTIESIDTLKDISKKPETSDKLQEAVTSKDSEEKVDDESKEASPTSQEDKPPRKEEISGSLHHVESDERIHGVLYEHDSEIIEDITNELIEDVAQKVDNKSESAVTSTTSEEKTKYVTEEVKEVAEKVIEKVESKIQESIYSIVDDKKLEEESKQDVETGDVGKETNDKASEIDDKETKMQTSIYGNLDTSQDLPQQKANDSKTDNARQEPDLKEVEHHEGEQTRENVQAEEKPLDGPIRSRSESPFKTDFIEKAELGRKSPKEREQDVAIIVASVAEVLKSDAPLEEFEGKLPFAPFTSYPPYTQELRETHITTLDSPITDDAVPIQRTPGTQIIEEEKEEPLCAKSATHSFLEEEKKQASLEDNQTTGSKISNLMKDSNDLLEATSKMISNIKSGKTTSESEKEETEADKEDAEPGPVHRMLVTASSEDGGEETVICPPGSITFPRSSDSSGRSSPDALSKKPSIDAGKPQINDDSSDINGEAKQAVVDSKYGKQPEVSGRSTPESKNGNLSTRDSSGKTSPVQIQISDVDGDIMIEPDDEDLRLTNKENKTVDEKDSKVDSQKANEEDKDKTKEPTKEINGEVNLSGKSTPEITIQERADMNELSKQMINEFITDLTHETTASEKSKETMKEISAIGDSFAETAKDVDIDVSDVKEITKEVKEGLETKIEAVEKHMEESVTETTEKHELEEIKEVFASEIKQKETIHTDLHSSGKSTPEVHEAAESTHKATPDSKDLDKPKDLPPVHGTVDSSIKSATDTKEPEKPKDLSGKSTPDVKEVDLSGKTAADACDVAHSAIKSTDVKDLDQSKDSSSKSTPDIKDLEKPKDISTPDVNELEKPKHSSGKSTPDIKDLEKPREVSGKSTPEPTIDSKEQQKAIDIDVSSGKSTPDIKDKLETSIPDKASSGKSTPVGKDIEVVSGKSTPEVRDKVVDEIVKDAVKQSEEKSGLSTPDQKSHSGHPSGKSTPDASNKDVHISTLSTPNYEDDLHTNKSVVESKESLMQEELSISCKSAPEVKDTMLKDKINTLSGKSTPEQKDILDKGQTENRNILQDSTKTEQLSGKSTPEIKDIPVETKISTTLNTDLNAASGKSTPDIKDSLETEGIPASGKATPEIIPTETKDHIQMLKDVEVVSGKSTPEIKDHLQCSKDVSHGSGKSTPDTKLPVEEMHISGTSTPVYHEESRKSSMHSELQFEDSRKSSMQSEPHKLDSRKSSLHSEPHLEDSRKSSVHSEPQTIEESRKSPLHSELVEDCKKSPVQEIDQQGSKPFYHISGSSTPEKQQSSDEEEVKSGQSTPDGKEIMCENKLQLLKNSLDSVRASSERLNVLKDGSFPISGDSTPEDEYDPNEDAPITSDSTVPTNKYNQASFDKMEQREFKHMQEEGEAIGKTDDLMDKLLEKEAHHVEDMNKLASDSVACDKVVEKAHIDDRPVSGTPTRLESSTEVISTHPDIPGPSRVEKDDKTLSPQGKDTLSGKSTPDIADVEKMKEMQDILKHEKHIPGSSTPPTVPASPIVKDNVHSEETEQITKVLDSTKASVETEACEMKVDRKQLELSSIASIKEAELRSSTPGSDDYDYGITSTQSDISSGQVSRAPPHFETERHESDEDDMPGSPTSVTSQLAHSPYHYDIDDLKGMSKLDAMNTSFYGALPDETGDHKIQSSFIGNVGSETEHQHSSDVEVSLLYELTKAKYSTGVPIYASENLEESSDLRGTLDDHKMQDLMTCSFIGTELPSQSHSSDDKQDPIASWGKPLGLPSPAPPNDNKGTPKKERKLPPNVTAKNKLNDDKKRSESPSKYDKKKKMNPIYVDLTYVPHHGNSNYSYVDFFKRVRARYYVFSGIEPSKEVYNALLEAKQTWEDKDLEVTIIPTYDTDVLGYWVAENEDLLAKYKIDLSPSASRCTINLQDHETSCSAYRLEF